MIDVTIDTNTSELMSSLKGFGPEVMRGLGNAFRRELRHTRSAGLAGFRATTLGRSMPKAASAGLVKLSRVRREEGGLAATLSAKGMAGLVELGGRTQPHVIKPRSGGVLALKGGAVPAGPGKRGFATAVRHPGGPVAAHPSLGPAAEGVAERIASEMRSVVLAIWGAQRAE